MTPTDPRPGAQGHEHGHSNDHSHDLDAFHAQHGHSTHDGLHNEDVAHEHSDVNVRALLLFCVGLVVVAVIVHVAMWGLFVVFEKQAAANDPVLSPHAVPAGQLPPEPRLLTDEPLNLKTVRDEESRILNEYGWIDQKTGTARLPIDEAKKRLLHGGLPVRPDAATDPAMGTYSASRGEASSGRTIPLRPGVPGPQQPAQPAAGHPPQAPPPAAPPHKGGH